jgi:hypothetical protein
VDVGTWVPIRWPCGPLAGERERGRAGSSAADLDALRWWSRPASLDLLAGTPVDCLVVPWAAGSAADTEQPRALAPLLAAAASRRLAVVGWVSAGADLGKAAAAGAAAGLDALATDSANPLAGLPVLHFRKRSLDALAAPAFLGDAGAVWPGVRPLNLGGRAEVDAVSGATSRPWIDSNAWYVRLARSVLAPKAVWLAFDPPDDRPTTPDAYQQAIADTEIAGARWLVSLDPALRRGLAEGQENARKAWTRIATTLRFFRRHADWADYRPVGQIGVLSDFTGANEFLSHELLNLLARRSALFTAIEKDRVRASSFEGLDAVLYVDEEPPASPLAAALEAFVERGGTLVAPPGWPTRGSIEEGAANPRFRVFALGRGRVAVARAAPDDPDRLAEDAELLVSHRHDRVRVFNVGAGQSHYATSGDGRSGVLHLLSYPTPYPRTPVTVWFRRPWAGGRDWRVETRDGAPVQRVAVDAGVEFHLPAVPTYCALEVSG